MAAQGVHASPKVTASCRTDGCLSFLTESTLVALQWLLGPMPGNSLPSLGQAQASCVQPSRR